MANITVITVVYNGQDTLPATIKSVAAFKNEQLDYIVIDGGSTDDTINIIQDNTSTITHWTSEPDRGIYDAMNKGWSLAKNDSYILFLGSGDQLLSLPKDLSTAYNVAYYGDVRIGERWFKPTHGFKLKLGNTLHHQALLIPKALHPQAPFDLVYKVYADFDFNQRLLQQGVAFIYSHQLKGYALPGGVSGQRADEEMLSIVKKNFGVAFWLMAKVYYKLQALKNRAQPIHE